MRLTVEPLNGSRNSVMNLLLGSGCQSGRIQSGKTGYNLSIMADSRINERPIQVNRTVGEIVNRYIVNRLVNTKLFHLQIIDIANITILGFTAEHDSLIA